VYGAIKAPAGSAADSPAGTVTEPGSPGSEIVGSPAATSPVVPTWTAVAGPTCSNSAATFSESGYYTAASGGQQTGWITSGSGGYSGDGCDGGYVSIPLSGQPGLYDPSRYAQWTFHLSAGYTHASCELYTFIPDNQQIAYVGGNPASYIAYGTASPSGSTTQSLGQYQIDQQTAERDQWLMSISVTVTTGLVTARLVDAGANTTPGTENAHAAAAQIKLTCYGTP
jgi:hypothetical protein